MSESTERRIGIVVLVVANLCVASWVVYALLAGCSRRDPATPWLVTRNHISYLGSILLAFRQDHGRYPSDLEELREWLRKGKATEAAFTWFFDGWGGALKYVPHAPRINRGRVDLYSVGKNGVDEYSKDDFGDDIHLLPGDGVGYGRLAKGIDSSDRTK
ncbi:MAG: hypothetical protein FJ290_22515 [Planctomycetes bacterium]|nr:hypothetical protein [Planctomycetota bacterium]